MDLKMFNFLFRRKAKTTKPKMRRAPISTQRTPHHVTDTPSLTLSGRFDYPQQLEVNFYNHIFGAAPSTSSGLVPIEGDFIDSIKQVINSGGALDDELPRLPDLIPRLLKLLRSDDCSWRDVVETITQDSVLVAGVIKVANSPLYRLNVLADNLEQIVVHLGQNGVREVVMSVAFKPIMQFKGNQLLQQASKKIWHHSLKSAIACRTIADHYDVNNFDAYLAGLMHTAGMSIIIKELAKTQNLTEIPFSTAFNEQIAALSKQITATIVEGWGMPQTVFEAISEQTDRKSEKDITDLGQILLQGSTVSMQHTLMTDREWLSQMKPEENLQNTLQDKPSERAYAELNCLKM